ncbi:MAG: YceI family protein [Nitrospirae bacterium]|nr:YceI family protein [Nitrospirota bacterium]
MSNWTIDPDHSVGAFSLTHLMVVKVHGQLNKVSGVVHLDPADVLSLSVELEIDASCISTGVQKRDDHLRSEEFFNVGKHPVISFKSAKIERTGFNRCKVSGALTICGITKETSIEATVSGPVKSPFGETCIGISGCTVINREDFGLTWNVPLENNGLMVGKYVEISVNVEADLKV